jgi:peptide/nickel transport system substrate-binding protein
MRVHPSIQAHHATWGAGRSKRLVAQTCIGLLSIMLAACQSGPPTGQPAATGGPGTSRNGGTLIVEEVNDPASFDMSISGTQRGALHATGLAYDSLLRFKHGPNVGFGELEIEPALAERWEVSPDARSYTFYLRKGLKFANLPPVNGRELTSADVKFSYEYWSRTGEFKDKGLPPGQFASYFEGMERIETPDPLTVKISFSKPFAPFLSYTAAFNNPILAREIYDQDGSFADRIVGSGPFQLDVGASQKGSRWVFKKNPNYWEAGKPYLDEVRWLIIRDQSSIGSAFKTKQLDMTGTMTFQEAEQFKRDSPDAVLMPQQSLAAQAIYMNERRPPLSDERVRKAISLAVDRDEFIQTFSGGKGSWSLYGAFPDTFSQEEIRQILKTDLNESRRLLTEAGYGNGLELEFLYPGNGFGEGYILEMQLFQSQLKKVGINLNIKSLDLPSYLERTRRDTYDITLRGVSVQPDVDSYLYLSFHPASQRNYYGVDDPNVTRLLEAQRSEPDVAKRRDIVREVVRYTTDHAMGLATYTPVLYRAVQPHVKNFAAHSGTGFWPVESTWLEK